MIYTILKVLLIFSFLFGIQDICLGINDPNEPANVTNPSAVKEVLIGSRSTANAAWWGFDPNDSTDAVQMAINSGAKKVIIPFMQRDWIVRPIKLASNQEIVFESGVKIVAKKDAFRSTGDCLFKATNAENVKISAYGAMFVMHKSDYMSSHYPQGQWRMGISLISCKNVLIEGVTVIGSGGDGIYIGKVGGQLSPAARICELRARQVGPHAAL